MVIHWFIPIILRLIFTYIFGAWFFKRMVSLPQRTHRFFFQFLFCSIIAICFAAISGAELLNASFVVLLIIGFFNGLAAFCQWKAIDISLSKTALFTFWDDIIAMTLSCIFLNETEIINSGIASGIAVSLFAVILFALHAYKKSTRVGKTTEDTKKLFLFFGYVAVYSLIWGVATFFIRYFAFNQLTIGTFLTGWYTGAFLAATLILIFYKEKTATELSRKTVKEKFILVLSGLGLSTYIMIALALYYWAYQITPLVVAQPFFLVGEMLLPALVGLFIFKEIKTLDRVERILFTLATAGAILIAVSF